MMIWSIIGVPLIIRIYTFIINAIILHFEFLKIATIIPKGMANTSININISKVTPIPEINF